MDKRWMFCDQRGQDFENGVDEFVKFVAKSVSSDIERRVFCPCTRCSNKKLVKIKNLKDHLMEFGMDSSYTVWKWHGEKLPTLSSKVVEPQNDDIDVDQEFDRLEEMLHDVGNNFKRSDMLDTLLSDAEKPLYPSCTKFTRLSAILKLFNLKAGNKWSDKSFTELLVLLKEMLPEGNELPDCTYEAKKILCPMGMEYKKIHACPNDCILYRNEYEKREKCPKCDAPRYKSVKDDDMGTIGPPNKVLWYLPIKHRFERLFANPRDAKNLIWHAERKKNPDDRMLRHPSDSPQWKTIDYMFPEFGNEPRNLKLGLCTDGINPYGNLGSQHSTWPVLLVIYNLPPWLTMKRKYIMLALLISGPRQPGNDIDVYLEPLIEDLKTLWDEGIPVFDAFKQELFTLRAMIFCTINDFPAYGNLSGYSVKGHKACPICEDETSYHQLKHGKKTVYLNHRRFLKRYHPYRKLKKAFNGSTEEGSAPLPLTGEQVYERVKNINLKFGKPYKPPCEKILWKKESVFFKLEYWKVLFVRHSLDVMHIEKNVCDSIIGTLLNIAGKTKDGVKARLDMVEMKIRDKLAPVNDGRRIYLPPACYTLSRKEKKSFCECLQKVKVPRGYSSNIRSLISLKDLKLVGLKSHDCHTLMQQLLPVAIRGISTKQVRDAITRLCFFFNTICSKAIDPEKLDELQNEVVVTLCQLEMYFPPSFFDIMVHLIVHLVREIKLCGPVFSRWMYPLERYMKILKGYVRNRHRPEGCIVEGYITEEVIEFCTDYLSHVDAIGLPKSRHEGRLEGHVTFGGQVVTVTSKELGEAHFYILQNTDDVHPYLDKHKAEIRKRNRGKREVWVQLEHNRTFISWFKNRVSLELQQNSSDVSEIVKWLAYGPNSNVTSYRGYDVNGFSFYTKSQDDMSTMQNSGVTVVAEAMHVSSTKDKNPIFDKMSYYGVIQKIWELDYVEFRVTVFGCKWVENRNGVRVDEHGLTLVDLDREDHQGEAFILASQAKQVFYITDPANDKWSVVLHGKKSYVCGEDEEDILDDVDDVPSFSSGIPPTNITDVDNIGDVYVRDDHAEGIWVEDPPLPK